MFGVYLTVCNVYYSVKDFFLYTIWGKKSPYQQMKENDPYIYEDDE